MEEAGPQQNSSGGEAGRDRARYPSEADGWPSHLLFGRHSTVIILYSGLLLSDAPPSPLSSLTHYTVSSLIHVFHKSDALGRGPYATGGAGRAE